LNPGEHVELRDIEYFAVIAEHGNVRRASEALDLSPGALSKALHRLEEAVQAKLFDRTAKGVELTPVGSAFLAQVRRLRLGFEDIVREAADLGQGRAGHLRVGASPADCEDLPLACTGLLAEAHKLTFELTVSDTDVIVPMLIDGKLDLVFNVIPASPYPGLVQEHLFDDEYVVYASSRHRLARARRVPMSELAAEEWVVSTANHRPKQILVRVLEENGLPAPRFVVETRSVRMRLQIIAGSKLIGFGPRRLIEKAGARFGLEVLAVDGLASPRPVGAIFRKDAYLPPAARRLIALFKSAAIQNA
jgi:DNA-binding transcriptional LysR family regulator